MTITLSPETESKLRTRAAQDGSEMSELADSILAAFLDGRFDTLAPNIVSIEDHDAEALDAAIDAGDADFAAGRYKSLEQIKADKRVRFGLAV